MSSPVQDVTIDGEISTDSTAVRKSALLTVLSTPEATTQSAGYYLSTTISINNDGLNLGYSTTENTGLMYFRARYYSAELGRFIGRDPLGYVDGMSLYRGYFVPGGVDPSGEILVIDDIILIVSVVSTIITVWVLVEWHEEHEDSKGCDISNTGSSGTKLILKMTESDSFCKFQRQVDWS